MPVNLSFTNSRGEEIVLDDSEQSFLGELYGRMGTEAPALDYTEITYADGSTKVLAIRMQPRDVTFSFWCPTHKRHLRQQLEELKQKLIQTGSRDEGENWGTLMIRRPDGRRLYLDCAYTGGLDAFIRQYPRLTKFNLSFHADDPLFYDGFEQTYIIKQDDRSGYLFMDPDLYMDKAVILDGADFPSAGEEDPENGLSPAEARAREITGDEAPGNLYWSIGSDRWYVIVPPESLYMMAAESSTGSDFYLNGEKTYPTIIINGPAENISLTNGNTGRKIVFNASVKLEMNEKIEIETRQRKRRVIKTDKYGVKTNLLSALAGGSSLDWWLVRGSNEILFENSATTPESYLKFVYKEGYLSAE
ncbi:MAG: hypothetical protein IJU38_07045 [Clostridia bacterium]|nr:hypothetical protein [Clostridia bacterium]